MIGDNTVLARNTKNAPISAIASQTVAFSHYNNFSAQLPIDPKTGELVAGGVKAQAQQCFTNLKAIVESIDHVMSDVVRITIFVRNIKDMDKVNEVYKTFFPTYVPAQTVVAVAALPMDALLQVEALLTCGEGTIPNAPQAGDLIKLTNNTANAPMSVLSTQSVAFSHYNNLTAQLPIDPKTGNTVVGIKAQVEQCLNNIKAIIESVDHVMSDVVKINVYLTNLEDTAALDEVYKTFFATNVPARRIVGTNTLPNNALVQIEAIVGNAEGTPPFKK